MINNRCYVNDNSDNHVNYFEDDHDYFVHDHFDNNDQDG